MGWMISILLQSLLLFCEALLPADSESHEVEIYMVLEAYIMVTLCFPEPWQYGQT